MQYDTLIRNATVIDGSNTPGYRADVAILDGRIERVLLDDLHGRNTGAARPACA